MMTFTIEVQTCPVCAGQGEYVIGLDCSGFHLWLDCPLCTRKSRLSGMVPADLSTEEVEWAVEYGLGKMERVWAQGPCTCRGDGGVPIVCKYKPLDHELTFVINGENVPVTVPPGHTLAQARDLALAESANTGRPVLDWDVYDPEGRILPPGSLVSQDTPTKLFLALKMASICHTVGYQATPATVVRHPVGCVCQQCEQMQRAKDLEAEVQRLASENAALRIRAQIMRAALLRQADSADGLLGHEALEIAGEPID